MENLAIFDTEAKMQHVLAENKVISVSISGGSDSDCLVDLFERHKTHEHDIRYIFFNTGLEYTATKEHLVYLEKRYGIEIERLKPEKTIPRAVRDHGIPFKSKITSHNLCALQKHNFDWKDIGKGYEYCLDKYDKINSIITWRFDAWRKDAGCPRYLRNYLYENGLDFPVSNKCCKYVKKDVAKKYLKDNKELECQVVGVRKAEGGGRRFLSQCYFDHTDTGVKMYYPLLHWTNEDKEYYKEHYGLVNSDCYEVWGMKRTGCAGCPYARDKDKNRDLIEKYEPKMGKACDNIFGEAYKLEADIKEWRKHKKPSQYDIK